MSTSEKKIQEQKFSCKKIQSQTSGLPRRSNRSLPQTFNIQPNKLRATGHVTPPRFCFFACFLDKRTEIYRHHGVLNLVRVPCGKFREYKH